MTATLFPFPRFRAFDLNGAPLSGGFLFSYAAGTTTPLATYVDETGLSANTNPVVLDATGSADVWLADAAYKLVLQDANSVQQWVVDNILPASPIAFNVQTVTATTTAALAALSTGLQVNFSGSGGALTLPDVSGSGFAAYVGVPIALFTTGNPYTIFAQDGVTQIGAVQSGGGTLMLTDHSTANGTWEINAVNKNVRGALVVATTQSINDSTVTAVGWSAATYDSDAIFSAGNPTRLTVPSGVSRVRIGASVYWDNAAGTSRFVNIKQGGGSFAGQPQDIKFMGGNTAFVAQEIWSPPIDVVPGNYFEVFVEQITGGAINVDGGTTGPTWFAMEVII